MSTSWYDHQVESLCDILQDLLSDDDPVQAKRALSEAIESWKSYHQKELSKWTALQQLLNVQ